MNKEISKSIRSWFLCASFKEKKIAYKNQKELKKNAFIELNLKS
jgi:hypothetical protein